jgi:hypothetical protein
MKTKLKISILLNFGLLGWLMVSLVREAKPVAEPGPRGILAARPESVGPATPSNSPAAKPEPFHWSQFYAKDYHVYVKNLRAAGCPESTLRAIVTADVQAAFQPEIAELESKLSALANRSWAGQLSSRSDGEAWKSELQHFPDEETALISDYLGVIQVSNTLASSLSTAPSPRNHQIVAVDTDAPIAVPLIAQSVDLATLNLDPDQLQAIADLRQRFMEKIGGPNQDPADPAYQARWRTAQAEVDNLMEGMLGSQAYQEYQLRAFAGAQTQSAQNAPAPDPSAPAAAGE